MTESIDELWRQVVAAGLAEGSQRDKWIDSAAPPDDPYALIDGWLAERRLTAYQAQALLEGDGRRVALGEYVILEPIGQGAMGAVFRARHRVLKRVVALKILRGDHGRDGESLSRFRREASLVGRLEHPNIVRAYDAGAIDGVHYIAMQLLAGQDLSRLVKETGPLPWPLAVDAIAQAARGLAYAHSQGVIHRDVKPGNLHLGDDGVVRVLDLGMASLRESDQSWFTSPGRMMGTIDYISPEQCVDAAAADARSDIYSLGLTLWTIATDSAPFKGSVADRLTAHRTAPRPDLKAAVPDAPLELAEYLRKMTAIDPNDRPMSMAEVAATLARWTDQTSSDVPDPGAKTQVSETPARSDSRDPLPLATLHDATPTQTSDASPAAPTIEADAPEEPTPAGVGGWLFYVAAAALGAIAAWLIFGRG